MTHYIHDEKNNRIEGMSKEEIYALIDEVIASGELPTDAQTAFVTALKSIVDGNAYKIGFCTQAEYNQLVAQGELVANALYIITDDETEQDINQRLTDIEDAIEIIEERIATGLRVNVTSIACACEFRNWILSSTSSYAPSANINYLNLASTNEQNQVAVLPANGVASIAEARVDYVSGDEGFIGFTLEPINTSNNYIEFRAYNVSNQYIYTPTNTGSQRVERQTTFRIYIKDIYGSEFTQEFTIDFKTQN